MKTFTSSQAKLAQPITDRPSDQVSYILYANWYMKSSLKKSSNLNSSIENHIFFLAN